LRVVETADWGMVRQNVSPFLKHPVDLNIFTRENVSRLPA